MYNLYRIHMESVGHPDARFDPLDLDFRKGPEKLPVDTTIWLRNGGGKTSFLRLFYSVVQPRRADLLGNGGGEKKSLDHYVLHDDIGHVVVEWGRSSGNRLAGFDDVQRLVTGQVMAWRKVAGKMELERHFYAFKPRPALLELDGLPFQRDVRHRMPLPQFLSHLKHMRDEHPELELVVTDNQSSWRQYLENQYFDTELFKYQVVMNNDEGGAAKFLDFKDGDSFAAFLLTLVTDANQVGQVDQNITRVANLFADRPNLEVELAFAQGLEERVPRLVAARSALAQARQDLQQRKHEARELLARITFSVNAARQEQTEQATIATQLTEQLAGAKADADSWQGQLLLLDEAGARLRLARVEELLVRAVNEATARAQEVDAWNLAERRLEERSLQGQIRTANAQMESNLAGLRDAYAESTVRYRLRLTQIMAREERELAGLKGAVTTAKAQLDGLESQLRGLAAKAGGLEAKREAAEKQLEDLESRRAKLVSEGIVRRDETLAVANERIESALAAATERVEEIRVALALIEQELPKFRAAELSKRTALTLREADLRKLREQRALLAGRLSALAEDHDIRDCMGGEVNVLAHLATIRSCLKERAAETARELISLGVDTQELERALRYLRDTELLPPSRDVERAIEILDRNKIGAVSGWQFLARNIGAEACPGFAERNPDIATGLVVNPRELDRAAELLRSAMVPAVPMTVAEDHAWRADSDESEGRRVIPSSAAHYDVGSADKERANYHERKKLTEGRRGQLSEYYARLGRLLADLEKLKEEAPSAGLAYYDAEIDRIENDASTLAEEIDRLASRIGDMGTDATSLNSEKDAREREARRLTGDQSRLGEFRAQADGAEGLKQELDTLNRDLCVLAPEIGRAEAEQRRWKETLGDVQGQETECEKRLTSLRYAGQQIDAVDPSSREIIDTGETLEDLRQTHLSAKHAFDYQASQSSTAQLLRVLQGQLRPISSELGQKPLALLDRVDSLLDGPDGATPVARESARLRAVAANESAVAKRTLANTDVEAARKEAEDARGRLETFVKSSRLSLGSAPAEEEEVRARLTEARQQYDAAVKRRATLEDETKAAEGRASTAAARARELNQIGKRLPRNIAVDPASVSESGIATLDVEAAEAAVEAIIPALDTANEALTIKASTLAEQARVVQRFAGEERFFCLSPVVRDPYLNEAVDALALTAAEQQEEIEKLRISLSDELAKLNRNRSGVVLELTHLVKDALTTLDDVQSVKLPNGLNEWSGQPYVRITYDEPQPDLLQGRMEAFVDDLIRSEHRRMEGVPMLIEAARAAVGRLPFKASVLKPNEGLPRFRAPVEEIKSWSGGQKLTTALLLYCVLAKLRARNVSRRGRPNANVGVLLLDNPIGTANLVDLVDLQLKVARELGIQLVVTTGVNDEDAIAAYPNIIRLRNQPARNIRLNFVGLADGETPLSAGSVVAARVLRTLELPERVAAGSEERDGHAG